MPKLLFAAAALLPAVARADDDHGLGIGYPSHAFSTGSGFCGASDMCIIRTIEECQEAATNVFHQDTKANSRYSLDIVPGCSVNNLGGLRFNSALTSEAVLPSDEGQFVLCQACETTLPGINEVPAATGTTTQAYATSSNYVFASNLCECDGYESIETKPECEAAASELMHHDVTANELSTYSQVRGCSTNGGGGLRFNDVSDSLALHAQISELKKTICRTTVVADPPRECTILYIESDDCTTEPGYCEVPSESKCLEGAQYLGVGDSVTTESSNALFGCAFSDAEGAVFNSNMDTTGGVRPRTQICHYCADTTPPPVVITTPAETASYEFADGDFCDGTTLCSVATAEDCKDAAAALSGSSKPLLEVYSSSAAPGCVLSSSRATFNGKFESTSTGGLNGGAQTVCTACGSSASRKVDLDGRSERNDSSGFAWWAYVSAGTATVVLIAVVVVVVVVKRNQAMRAKVAVVPSPRGASDRRLVSPSNVEEGNTTPSAVNVVDAGSVTI